MAFWLYALAALLALAPLTPALAEEKAADDASKTDEEFEEDEEDDEEWKADEAPQLKMFELHGYFRIRADFFENLDLGTWNPYFEKFGTTGANQNPIGTRGTSRVLPPVTNRPGFLNDQFPQEKVLSGAELKSLLSEGKISSADYQAAVDGTRPIYAAGAREDGNFSDLQDAIDDSSNSLRSVNMRLRLEPIINVSDQIKVLMQIDILDNLVLGSTPDTRGANSINAVSPLPPFSQTQAVPSDGRNGITDSIRVKRAWAEVMTPLGQLRFGRMPSQWGLGLLANSGNGIDQDQGSTADRIMFVTGITSINLYFVPAFDFVSSGYLSTNTTENGLQFPDYNVESSDDVMQFVFAVAKRDKDDQILQALENDKVVVNGGMYNVYRWQKNDFPSFSQEAGAFNSQIRAFDDVNNTLYRNDMVRRDLKLWAGDIWLKLLYRKFRFEMEAVMVRASFNDPTAVAVNNDPTSDQFLSKLREIDGKLYAGALHPLEFPGTKVDVFQWGYAMQFEGKLLSDRLMLAFEHGAASGDDRGGFGLRPLFARDRQYNFKSGNALRRLPTLDQNVENARATVEAARSTLNENPNSADALTAYQAARTDYLTAARARATVVAANVQEKLDTTIENFRFHPDYRVDMILWREVIGQVTDALYFKPSVQYNITQSFAARLDAIYSRAMYRESTPGFDNNLGVELDLGLSYLSDDGFLVRLDYAILFPMRGMDNLGGYYNPDVTARVLPDGRWVEVSPDSFVTDDGKRGSVRALAADENIGTRENQLLQAEIAQRIRLMAAIQF